MGIFKSAAEHLGSIDHKLIRTGTLARGEIVSVEQTGMGIGGTENSSAGEAYVCKITVTVVGFNGMEPYQASCLYPVPGISLAEIQTPGAAVAIRVDPTNPQNIALDAQTEAPDGPAEESAATEAGGPVVLVSDDGTEVPLATHTASLTAAQVLEQGLPCTVDVLAIIPIDEKNAKGEDLTGLILNVHKPGRADSQAQIGTHVPPELASRVVVGATLPAKFVDSSDDTVVPDWAAIKA